MLLGFGYLHKFVMFCFFFFFQKGENKRLNKNGSWPKFFNIIFRSVGPVDQQINNLVPP